MARAPVRDPLADHLVTPQNSAFLLIDYQPHRPTRVSPAWSSPRKAYARSVIEVVAEEMGPSLRWATAAATRTTRSQDR